MEWGGIWELSELFTQFCCKLKPSLNAGALRRGAKDLIRHFCKDKQIPNKHMRGCSILLEKCKLKPQWGAKHIKEWLKKINKT